MAVIICVGKLHKEAEDYVPDSRLSDIYSYFCRSWAAECFIICLACLGQNLSSPLDPLIALGLFLCNRCLSIQDNPYGSDATIKYLYILTLHYHQIDSQNVTTLQTELINTEITEYDRLTTLVNTLKQPKLVEEAISEAKSRISVWLSQSPQAATINYYHNLHLSIFT